MGSDEEAAGSYILGRSSAEYERLAAQARVWEGVTRVAISKTGLRPGMSALDVGCGTGAVMRLMGEVVGPAGSVTGVDVDGALGEQMLARLRDESPDIYRFINMDFMEHEQIDGGPFDLVFARLLIVHMPDQPAALSALWRQVKPGGTLLVMDCDMSVMRSFPDGPGARACKLMREIFTAAGKDIEVGTRMPELFLRAGIGVPDACEIAGVVIPGAAGGGMIRQVLASLRDTAIKFNVANAAAMDAIDAELAQIVPNRSFGRYPDMSMTRKRKAA